MTGVGELSKTTGALDPRMASKVFKGMKVFESRPSSFVLRKPATLDRLITARLAGKRVEIGIDQNDIIDVCVFREDEAVELGMDAVLKALEEGE